IHSGDGDRLATGRTADRPQQSRHHWGETRGAGSHADPPARCRVERCTARCRLRLLRVLLLLPAWLRGRGRERRPPYVRSASRLMKRSLWSLTGAAAFLAMCVGTTAVPAQTPAAIFQTGD